MRACAPDAAAMFKLLDRDGGGSLDMSEISSGLIRLGVWLLPDELQSIMDALGSVRTPALSGPSLSLFGGSR